MKEEGRRREENKMKKRGWRRKKSLSRQLLH
jgi:hypothetical protein